MKSKVIIIGAPRSGTNMLRDILCGIKGVSTWPCDEINYVWRYGNSGELSDEFSKDMAHQSTIKYIQKQFEWVARSYTASTVVEKTCANSLRVPFVNEVIPDAKYIYIVRDGLDVVGSSKLRWTAGFELLYSLKKARFIPLVDLSKYVYRYAKNRIYRMLSAKRKLASWGPSLSNMEDITRKNTLNEVCALQWSKCVTSSDSAFSDMNPDAWYYLKYENFVESPEEELGKILNFIEVSISKDLAIKLVENVSVKNIGKGRAELSICEIEKLKPIIGSMMESHGYKI